MLPRVTEAYFRDRRGATTSARGTASRRITGTDDQMGLVSTVNTSVGQ